MIKRIGGSFCLITQTVSTLQGRKVEIRKQNGNGVSEKNISIEISMKKW